MEFTGGCVCGGTRYVLKCRRTLNDVISPRPKQKTTYK
jgi:hypothetical protein